MMIRIAIAEDEPRYAQQLQDYLQTFGQEYGHALDVRVFPDGAALLENYRCQYDLLLLDVEMPQLDGMTTAQRIRQRDPAVVILFITNMAQYAIRGYEVDALDYILKPVSYFSFSQRLNRAISRIKPHSKHFLVLSCKGGTVKLDTNTLYYVESQGHNLIFHSTNGTHTVSGTLLDIEEKLSGLPFFRCNKGSLVSLQHVDGVQDGCALVHGEHVLISRARKNEFMEALADYLSGVTL